MSNPYDPNSNPYGNEPSGGGYGQGGAGQGGGYGQGGGGYGSPYGQPGQPSPYGGGSDMPAKTDAVSIIGFVLSLTCCLSVVGAIMGFIGLGRTKGGKRKGRWAAVAAAIIGVIGTLVAVGAIVFIVVFAKSAITPDNAEVGQCANVTETDDSIGLREQECDSDHDAEIVAVDEYGALDPELIPSSIDDITDSAISQANCSSLMDEADAAELAEGYEWTLALEDPNDPADSDTVICFVEKSNGDKLTAPLLD